MSATFAAARVIPFPARRPPPDGPSFARLDAGWARAADMHLQLYAGWLWPGPDGWPEVPGWVGDVWAEWVIAWVEIHPGARPAEADWPRLWCRFTESWLRHQPEWRAAVEAACREIGEAS